LQHVSINNFVVIVIALPQEAREAEHHQPVQEIKNEATNLKSPNHMEMGIPAESRIRRRIRDASGASRLVSFPDVQIPAAREASYIRIQASWRGFVLRQKSGSFKQRVKQRHSASCQIQNAWKRHLLNEQVDICTHLPPTSTPTPPPHHLSQSKR
jgi:hypothetical protein